MNPDLTQVVAALNHLADAQQKGWLEYTNAVVLLATLVVLIWYTIETARLRRAAQTQTAETASLLSEAQRQNETTLRPIFSIRTGEAQRIVLENVGLGPAFNVAVVPPSLREGMQMNIDYDTNVIKPGQVETLLFVLCRNDNHKRLDVNELYRTINIGEVPCPLNISVLCSSADGQRYEQTFQFSPSQIGRLHIAAIWAESAN